MAKLPVTVPLNVVVDPAAAVTGDVRLAPVATLSVAPEATLVLVTVRDRSESAPLTVKAEAELNAVLESLGNVLAERPR